MGEQEQEQERVLVLDLDGVVVTGHQEGGRWDKHIGRDLKLSPELLQRRFFELYWRAVMTGQSDLKEALAEAWPSLGCETSIEEFVHYWFKSDSNVDRDVLECVARWRANGRKAFLATNQEHYRARFLWDDLGLARCFDGLIYSAELGVAKPETLFFELALARLPARQPSDVLFLDDVLANVEAASSSGWTARHYRSVKDLAAVTAEPKAGSAHRR
jgi:putative hydrolase of the HAD superfamily